MLRLRDVTLYFEEETKIEPDSDLGRALGIPPRAEGSSGGTYRVASVDRINGIVTLEGASEHGE